MFPMLMCVHTLDKRGMRLLLSLAAHCTPVSNWQRMTAGIVVHSGKALLLSIFPHEVYLGSPPWQTQDLLA